MWKKWSPTTTATGLFRHTVPTYYHYSYNNYYYYYVTTITYVAVVQSVIVHRAVVVNLHLLRRQLPPILSGVETTPWTCAADQHQRPLTTCAHTSCSNSDSSGSSSSTTAQSRPEVSNSSGYLGRIGRYKSVSRGH